MPGPGDRQQPPTREVRDEAIRVIDAAYVDGQLDGPEYDARVAGVLAASSAWQLERHVDDLQAPAAEPDRDPPARARLRQRARSAVAGVRTEIREELAGYPRWLKVTMAALVLGLTLPGVGAIIHEVVTDDDRQELVGNEPPASGLADFRDDYRDEFGSTLLVSAQINPEWARVEVPVEDSPPRHETWTWQDGSFNRSDEARGGHPGRLDLAEIDVAAADENLARAWTGLEVPEASTVTILLSARQEAGRITFVVSNDYQETGRLVTDLSGDELRREPFVAPDPGGG